MAVPLDIAICIFVYSWRSYNNVKRRLWQRTKQVNSSMSLYARLYTSACDGWQRIRACRCMR